MHNVTLQLKKKKNRVVETNAFYCEYALNRIYSDNVRFEQRTVENKYEKQICFT